MNPARHMQGEKTMQPDNLHEILRQSKVLPLSLGRDGEMWWPDGLLLDGIKKRLPAYREAVLPKERAEFDAALDAAWKYGEVVFDHTVCPGGGNCLHARLRLRRISPDECRGILRMVPEKSGNVELPPVGSRVTRLCGAAAEQFRNLLMNPDAKYIQHAQLLMICVCAVAVQIERILDAGDPLQPSSPVCTVGEFIQGIMDRFDRIVRKADQQIRVETHVPNTEIIVGAALECVNALLLCAVQRIGQHEKLTLRVSVESDTLLVLLRGEHPLLNGPELEYIRRGQAAEPSSCRIDLLTLCAEARNHGGSISESEGNLLLRIPARGPDSVLPVRDSGPLSARSDYEARFRLLAEAVGSKSPGD